VLIIAWFISSFKNFKLEKVHSLYVIFGAFLSLSLEGERRGCQKGFGGHIMMATLQFLHQTRRAAAGIPSNLALQLGQETAAEVFGFAQVFT
jgi:glycerol uptake facilitator-like aquaporin